MLRTLLHAVLLSAALTSPVFSQYEWTPYENNPVMDVDFDRTSAGMFRPAVLKIDGVFHMWYGKQVGLAGRPQRSVGYATSADGIAWTLESFGALEPSGVLGTFDEEWATYPTVVADGDTLRMWYTGTGRLENARGIGYAWSTDGVNWTKVRGPSVGGSVFHRSLDPANPQDVLMPTAVKINDTFHLWYAKFMNDGFGRVGYVQSTNGIDWTVIPGSEPGQSVVDVGGFSDFDASLVIWPWVIFNEREGVFEMWYQGVDAIQFGGVSRVGCARSSDGVNWEKVPGSGDAGACWNSLAQPSVVLDDETYKMWYTLTTNVSPNNDIVQYAVSESTPTSAPNELPGQGSPFSAFPNPFTSAVTIEASGLSGQTYRLDVVDPLGRTIVKMALQNRGGRIRTTIEPDRYGSFARGTYLVRVSDSDGLVLGSSVLHRQ